MRINEIAISEHFKLNEFQCPCCHNVKLHPELFTRLLALRNEWGRPIIITSGYRCPEHNTAVGGEKNSLHRAGLACDIKAAEKEQEILKILPLKHGFSKILCYPERKYMHIDVGEKA